MEPLPQINCGLDCPIIPSLYGGLNGVDRSEYTFVCLPIIHPRLRRKYGPAGVPYTTSFTRSDILLDPNDWSNRVVVRASPYINVDTPYPKLRQQHEDCLLEELNYCRGIGISVVLITLRGPNNNNLARLMNYHLNSGPFNPNFWVQVTMENSPKRAFGGQFEDQKVDDDGTWGWWSNLHKQTDWDRRISLALKLSADLPSEAELARWIGEPIKCLIIPTDIFCTNRKNYPVLSKPHQEFVKKLLQREVQMMITGVSRHMDIMSYLKYLQHLSRGLNLSIDPMTNYAKGWEDYLQTPLQPLSDNLDSYTYNVFEKDPVKYDNYQSAICDALKSRYDKPVICKCGSQKVKLNGSSDSANITDEKVEDKCDDPCKCQHSAIIMVLGAGRGPLVRAVLNAAKLANVNVKIYAVEKNPTALVTLHAQQREIWGDQVSVIANDMRKFQPEELADIIVSELLGSFGDNELSPECLDGARHLIKEDGISIPYDYTSFISPVMCSRLWGCAKANESMLAKNAHPLEMPWVVYLQNKYEIAAPKELFTFTHPCEAGDGSNVERRRWKCVKFPVSCSCTLHGFIGYFSCTLFKEHTLSIVPDTHSKGMISWFPIFFPIKSPISLKSGQTIEVNFWRCSNARKVWYEWNLTSPELQLVHNSGGKSCDMII